jgi:hypothetical protein
MEQLMKRHLGPLKKDIKIKSLLDKASEVPMNELSGSRTRRIPKPDTGHDPEPVPSIFNPQTLSA